MLAGGRELARKFRVVRRVSDASDDPARRALREKLRALGYVR
jgi:hypothetical protein